MAYPIFYNKSLLTALSQKARHYTTRELYPMLYSYDTRKDDGTLESCLHEGGIGVQHMGGLGLGWIVGRNSIYLVVSNTVDPNLMLACILS